jgi:glycosyltransferase involved in cell wall biosynthesis
MRRSWLQLTPSEAGGVAHGPNAEGLTGDGGQPQRKVLVITYRFPPQGGGGVQRTLKFVKYLPQFGWLPVVHTVRNPDWPLRDATLLAEIPPQVHVYRTWTLEFDRLKRGARALLAGVEPGGRNSSPGAMGPTRSRTRLMSAGKTMAAFIRQRILIPDPQVAWLPYALLKSFYISRAEGVSLLYTSSPPNSCQILGLLVKKLTDLPWVADFRDPWTEGIRRKQAYVRNKGRQRLEEALERLVLMRANHVLVTTEKTLEQFVMKYPSVPAEKFSVITNGFDPADFVLPPAPEPLLNCAEFNVTLTGNVEAMFDATPFFGAVKELIEEDREIHTRLRVNFIGTKRGKYDEFITQNGLDQHVRYIVYVPHATSLRYLSESDVLFLCQIPVYESASSKLSGKLFEYLYMRKPILALTLPGLTADILSRSGLGIAVDPNDRSGIKRALRELYLQWRAGRRQVSGDEAYIGGFYRIHQTQCLAQIFERAAPADPRQTLRR